MTDRNPYIVTKALNSYLKGSVIIAISSHLVTTTDALMVSWLIGPKALTAVNIVIPVLALFSTLMIMLSTGASISISKALGHRDKEAVNLSFSSSFLGAMLLGVISAFVTYKFASDIVSFLTHGDDSLFEYSLQYLKTYCYGIPFLIMAGVLGNVARTDGNTRLVSIAVWIGIILNVILDVVFVGFLNYGIAGAAWATAINYLLVLIICLFHFVSRDNTIKWSSDFRHYFIRIVKNCKLGFSTSLANLLLAVSLFAINSLMLRYQGDEGIYCWAVCYQIFLILQMLLSGIDASIFAIGGVLLGEDDVTGLDFLYRRSAIYLIITVIVLSGAIIFFPEFFGNLFGNKGEDRLDLLPSVLKIFSIFLLPYALIMQVRAVYTILERGKLSLFLCIAIFSLMILFVFIACVLNLNPIWWSFPISAWFLLFFVFIYSSIIHFRNKNLRLFSLIPKTVPDPAFNTSVSLNEESVHKAESDITSFLQDHKINTDETGRIINLTDRIINIMLQNLLKDKKKKRFFDINTRIKTNKIIIILKDDGNRLDQEKENEIINGLDINLEKEKSQDPEATKYINFTTNYFYMNEQNTFTLSFG